MSKRHSVESQIVQYFRSTDLPIAEALYRVVTEEIRARRPRAAKAPKTTKSAKAKISQDTQIAGGV